MKLVILFKAYSPKRDSWLSLKTVASTLLQFMEWMEAKGIEFTVVDAWPVTAVQAESVYWDKEYTPFSE